MRRAVRVRAYIISRSLSPLLHGIWVLQKLDINSHLNGYSPILKELRWMTKIEMFSTRAALKPVCMVFVSESATPGISRRHLESRHCSNFYEYNFTLRLFDMALTCLSLDRISSTSISDMWSSRVSRTLCALAVVYLPGTEIWRSHIINAFPVIFFLVWTRISIHVHILDLSQVSAFVTTCAAQKHVDH